MSYNWANVTWQTKDGRWGVGFYDRISYTDSWEDEDYDSEWDDEFDYDVFIHASTGHTSLDSAMKTWNGANPGHTNTYRYNRANAKTIAEFEDMAKACNSPAYAKERADRIAKAEYTKRRKEVIAKMREKEPRAGRNTVTIGLSGGLNPYAGAYGILDTTLVKDGDWLVGSREHTLKSGKKTVKKFKVWNTKTRLPAKDILNAEAVNHRFYGYW